MEKFHVQIDLITHDSHKYLLLYHPPFVQYTRQPNQPSLNPKSRRKGGH